jgi:hypothetical protein
MQYDGRQYDIFSELVAYQLDDGDLTQGREVWSEMYESKETLDEFYQNRYGKYTYHSE